LRYSFPEGNRKWFIREISDHNFSPDNVLLYPFSGYPNDIIPYTPHTRTRTHTHTKGKRQEREEKRHRKKQKANKPKEKNKKTTKKYVSGRISQEHYRKQKKQNSLNFNLKIYYALQHRLSSSNMKFIKTVYKIADPTSKKHIGSSLQESTV
jgi:hypothetical protein